MNQATSAVAALLHSQPKPVCAALTPFTLVEADIEARSLMLEFPPQPAFRNHFGNVQGGFAVAVLDVVVSVAVFAALRQWAPTIEIKTSFLEPLPIGVCLGEGRVLKSGRSLAFVEGRLMTPERRVAVTATATVLLAAH